MDLLVLIFESYIGEQLLYFDLFIKLKDMIVSFIRHNTSYCYSRHRHDTMLTIDLTGCFDVYIKLSRLAFYVLLPYYQHHDSGLLKHDKMLSSTNLISYNVIISTSIDILHPYSLLYRQFYELFLSMSFDHFRHAQCQLLNH